MGFEGKEEQVEKPSDRARWNARYRQRAVGGTPIMLGRDLHHLPRRGRAIDVASGAGAAAVVLAARGLSVTAADVSDVALEQARARAESAGVTIETLRVDLRSEPFPPGPWDLITCFNYLDRDLFPVWIEELAPGGMLAVAIATRSNLERHEHPSPRFLLDDGELVSLLGDLEIVLHREGWNLNGRHVAEAVVRKP